MIFPNKSIPHVVRAAAVTTTSYVAGTVVTIGEHNMIGIQVSITKNDETSFQFKVESSVDGGVTFGQQVTLSASGGTTTLAPQEYSITGASLAASQVFTFIITPIKGDQIKISTKSTGGTPLGTVAITCITGWA